jgi:undecaprenyl diphosphate synthase
LTRGIVPRHVGVIPDGNRRWAVQKDLPKEAGYAAGVEAGLLFYENYKNVGIEEVSVYGFTKDNTKRAPEQMQAFKKAVVDFAFEVYRRGAALLVVGDYASNLFPDELIQFCSRKGTGLKVNLLVNYGWDWDVEGLKAGQLRSHDVSRIDLVVRWGGGRRLSGFLPIQSVYADFYVIDAYWPDFQPAQFEEALKWFKQQDRTFGG